MAAVKAASDAAGVGAANTEEMVPKFGRAAYYGESSKGNIDAGAVVGALIFKGMYDYLSSETK